MNERILFVKTLSLVFTEHGSHVVMDPLNPHWLKTD